ncbi:TPA: hypothetical protein ACS8CD_003587 [Providencia alcalifaciens]|uniref:Phage abortive infection protein n=1 Tax=Providencia alcalifaciens TaxID=126385 RepID=A0AAW9VCF8_9GAMM|nr:hypothetical protein [Providencia alcalifaciens]EKT62606.1 hypothetical protein OO9_18351 [Providencia alcalifaciens Dmel2]MTC35173.1 hypothetical protein [Providencia alcalifaciens]
MTWWIAFTIAIAGWYFTARLNAKNSVRTLINQEIKELRSKLHDLIVSCSSDECELPLKPMSECFIKMQTYIVSVQELDKLYEYYRESYFKHIRVFSIPYSKLKLLLEHESLSGIKEFIRNWLVSKSHLANSNHYANFDIYVHASTIRQILTGDEGDLTEEHRIAMLNLQYKNLCLAYQFVS